MKFQRHLIGALVCLGLAGCQSPASQFRMGRNASQVDVDEELASSPPSDTPAASETPTAKPAGKPTDVLLQEAQLALQSGDLDAAEVRFHEVLKVDPMNATAHHRLAVIADRHEDYRAAEKHYLVAYQETPNDANLLSDMGYSYLLRGDNINAKRFLNEALAKNPEHPQAANNLGAIYAQEGDADQALAMFRLSGSEQQAQAKLAYVMNQRSSSTFASTPQMDDSLPELGAKSPLDINRSDSAPGGEARTAGLSEEHRRLVEEMRIARESAERERQLRNQQAAGARQGQLPMPRDFAADDDFAGAGYDLPRSGEPADAYASTSTGYEYNDQFAAIGESAFNRDNFDETTAGREVHAATNTDRFGIRITPNDGQRSRSFDQPEVADDMSPSAAWPPKDDFAGSSAAGHRSTSSQGSPRSSDVIHAGGVDSSRSDAFASASPADDRYATDTRQRLPQFESYLEPVEREAPSASFVNPSSGNPREYASRNLHVENGQDARQAAMLAGLNAGPSQLFPVQAGGGGNYAEFPATETRLGADFSQPSRSLPGADEMRNWSVQRQTNDTTYRQSRAAPAATRLGHEFEQPGRTTSARYDSFRNGSSEELQPTAWDEPSPSVRALQEQSQFNNRR